MANDIVQFVDSISATATLRLDINDGTKWEAEIDGFDFSPPPLRRAINGTLLTDGSVVSASSYDNRTLIMELSVIDASVDAVATQTQLLNRELDRDGNYLKWQPNTATSPVFFRTLRSPATRITEIPGNGTYKTFEVSVLAEPFAYGLREDIGAVTVNNDPAAGANGQFFDVANVKGDVATPAFIRNATTATTYTGTVIAVRQHGTVSNLVNLIQCENAAGGIVATDADTTNPGGGPDAAMSGTGTNNYMHTTFATSAVLKSRVGMSLSALTNAQLIASRGTFRVFAVVRRSDNTSVINIAASNPNTGFVTTPVAVPLDTARQIVDCGLLALGQDGPESPGRYGAATAPGTPSISMYAQRVSGAGSIDWDYVLLAPADESLLLTKGSFVAPNMGVWDGGNEISYVASADPFGGAAQLFASGIFALAGGFPQLTPGQTTRVFWAQWTQSVTTGANAIVKTDTASIVVSYWPRYLYARPATT